MLREEKYDDKNWKAFLFFFPGDCVHLPSVFFIGNNILCNADFVNPINFSLKLHPPSSAGNINNSEYSGNWHQCNYAENLVVTLNAS